MRIAIVSGSRADEGPLRMVEDALAGAHEVQWYPVGPFGIDTSSAAADAAAAVIEELGETFGEGAPDLAILLGDRYEILGAAVACNIMGLPIAHLSGGDLTEGSQDDCYRHAITKLSHLHFATCEESAARIIQMGEEPERVHVVGCPGVDRIRQTKLLSKHEALSKAGLSCRDYVVACLHPNTLGDTADDVDELMVRIWEGDHESHGAVLIGPNADAGNEDIRAVLKNLAKHRAHTVYHETLEGDLYLSLLKHASAFIGNSSAIYYECPTLGTPVIEIGDRQKGRKPHKSDGHAAERIAAIISKIENPKALLRKRFHAMRT